jgi:hypothetical protein
MQRVISITAKTAKDMEYKLDGLRETQIHQDGYPTGYFIESIESFSVVSFYDALCAFVLVNVYERED